MICLSFLKPYASFTSLTAASIPSFTLSQNSPFLHLLTTAILAPSSIERVSSISGMSGLFFSSAFLASGVSWASATSGATSFSASSFWHPVSRVTVANKATDATAALLILISSSSLVTVLHRLHYPSTVTYTLQNSYIWLLAFYIIHFFAFPSRVFTVFSQNPEMQFPAALFQISLFFLFSGV